MAACTLHQCVFGDAPWTTGSSPVVTSLLVVAMPLRIRALPRQEKPSQKASPKTPPLKEGRRSAERRTTGPHRKAMRRAPFLLSSHCGRTEAARDLKNGAGALAFRRPTAASEAFGPRLGS